MSAVDTLRRRLLLAGAVDGALPLAAATSTLSTDVCDAGGVSALDAFAGFFAERGDHDTAAELRERARLLP